MVDVAIEAATRAGELALRYFEHARNKPSYFKNRPKISYKPDGSPVTRADIEAEKLIRKIISKKFPDHGIIGEELPPVNPKARFQWVIDPIDGTRYFAAGFPYWGTLLAVLEKGKPIIGIAYIPVLSELYVAQIRKGAFLNHKRIRVSRIKNLNQSTIVSTAGLHYFTRIDKLDALTKLQQITLCRLGIGGAYGYALVASARAEICVDPASEIHDIAAPAIIITEAGGKFTNFKGKITISAGSFLATNGLLHQQVLKILK